MPNKLAPHEALEVHNFLSQEILAIKKISSNINIAKDNELKSFMQDSINSKKNALVHIQSTLTL